MTKKLIGALFAFSLVLAACGDDSGGGGDGDGDGDERDAIVSFLEAQGETPESAECFANELSEYSLSDFESEDDTDVSRQLAEDIAAAADVCATADGS